MFDFKVPGSPGFERVLAEARRLKAGRFDPRIFRPGAASNPDDVLDENVLRVGGQGAWMPPGLAERPHVLNPAREPPL